MEEIKSYKMQRAIDILEKEIDSMKDAYKSEGNDAFKREYSERILSCENAIKNLKKDYKSKYEKCISTIRRFDAGIIGMYDL